MLIFADAGQVEVYAVLEGLVTAVDGYLLQAGALGRWTREVASAAWL